MTSTHKPLEFRVARPVVSLQTAAAVSWAVAALFYRGFDFVLAAPLAVLLLVGCAGNTGSRTWGRFWIFVAEVFVLIFCVFGGFYDDALGIGLIVSALLVLPGILPGFAPGHGR